MVRTGLIGALALAFALSPGSAVARSAPAELMRLIEDAPAVIVGRVVSVEPLVHAAYLAKIEIESLLAGDAAKETVWVAWEEPAPSLPARFAADQRLVLALAPLPTASIWKTRIKDAARRSAAVSIAGSGDAYLRQPSAADLNLLRHYLSLSAAAREGDAGRVRLSQMSVRSEPRMARAALTRLLALLQTDNRPMAKDIAQALVATLLRTDDPELAGLTISFIGGRRPPALGPVLEGAIAQYEPNQVPINLFAAKGAQNGEIDEDTALALLAAAAPDKRVTAARYARGPKAERLLQTLLRTDPSDAVRAEAVTRLVAIRGMSAAPDALHALDDQSTSVRAAAAHALAALGPEAIPDLTYVVETGSTVSAQMAVATLSMMGTEAHYALAVIAEEHEDPGIRALAGIAIGLPLGHQH